MSGLPTQKTCRVCKESKSLDLFYKHPTGKDGHRNDCISCSRDKKKQYYKKNSTKIIANVKQYAIENRDKVLTNKRKYRQDHIEQIKQRESTEEARLKRKARRIRNRERTKETKKLWLLKNPGYAANYNKKRREKDINFKLTGNLRHRAYMIFKGYTKNSSHVKDLGCSVNFAREHIESLFQPGMTWDNWTIDGWHLDHIIPLNSFDLDNREEMLKAFHYTNLQPLWAFDNLSKGAKI